MMARGRPVLTLVVGVNMLCLNAVIRNSPPV
jgi:hypothetical protein